MHKVQETKQNPSVYRCRRMCSLWTEKAKTQKMIYNSLITLETTCTLLVGEKEPKGNGGKNNP